MSTKNVFISIVFILARVVVRTFKNSLFMEKATVHFNQLRYNVVPFPAYFAFLVGSNAFGLFCFIFFCSKQLQEIKITSDTIQIRIRWVRSSCSALRATSTTHLTICIYSSILASYATIGVT